MNVYLIIVFAIGTMSTCFSQEVIASSGNYHSNDKFSINWTMGEVLIQTLKSNNEILFQGFQQPWSFEYTQINPGMEYDISIYPNPVNKFLTINYEQFAGLQCEIYSIEGKMVLQNTLLSDQSIIDFSELPPSIYLLKIFLGNEKLKDFKIIKTNSK